MFEGYENRFIPKTMKYENFDIEDFIADEFFVSWIRQDSKEANLFWQSWLAEHPDKIEKVQKAREIILNAQPKRIEPSQKDYTEVLEGILSPNKRLFYEDTTKKGHGIFKYAASISILLALLGGLFYFNHIEKVENTAAIEEVVMNAKKVPFGQKSTIILSDGSKVKLNAGATLTYPEKFGHSKSREVYLSGEAFFEIARDTARPFLIKSKEVTTKVLGTSFNLKEKAGSVSVTVLTGKVKVFTESDTAANDAVFLKPGQQADYNPQSNKIEVSHADLEAVTAWKEDIIYFEQANFKEVASRLEKWYGVKVELKRNVDGKFSGRFKNKALKDVLTGLSYTSDFEFDIENETVFIY